MPKIGLVARGWEICLIFDLLSGLRTYFLAYALTLACLLDFGLVHLITTILACAIDSWPAQLNLDYGFYLRCCNSTGICLKCRVLARPHQTGLRDDDTTTHLPNGLRVEMTVLVSDPQLALSYTRVWARSDLISSMIS